MMATEILYKPSPEVNNKKSAIVKKIAKAALWIFCIVGISILFMKTLSRHNKLTCTRWDIKMEKQGGFISSASLMKAMESRFMVVGKPCESVKLEEIEKWVYINPFVEKTNLFFDLKGVLHVSIWQKIPVLWVHGKWGQTFMIDGRGLKMPSPGLINANLVEVKGDIAETYAPGHPSEASIRNDSIKTPELKMAYALWRKYTQEPSVDELKWLEWHPLNGLALGLQNFPFPVVWGDTSSFHEKWEKLKILKSVILPKMGPKAYSRVDLRFYHEWVCEKLVLSPHYTATDSLDKALKINKLLAKKF